MRTTSLRRLRRRLVLILVVYFFAGAASQKLIPWVDEVFPFTGWSLFSKVPNLDSRYSILIDRHGRRALAPPVPFLQAPDSMVTGNRYLARKVIQRLGRAYDEGEREEAERLRQLLEHDYLIGTAHYELVFERYQPLEKWRTGANRERRSLASFDSGNPGEAQRPR